MKRLAPLLLSLVLPIAAQAQFRAYELSADGRTLVYTTASGARSPAPALGEQVAFSMPRVSGDGRFIGWLALHPNCCTSYPIPLTLVILDRDLQLREFQGAQATFNWCFVRQDTAVAYRRALLHGLSPDIYELRRIVDGKLLQRFEFGVEVAAENRLVSRLPAWARCAAP